MDNHLLGLAAAAIVFMIHFALVDFRFRVAGGLMGIWSQNPAPPALWIVRLTFIPAFLAALSLAVFGPSQPLWIIIGLLVLVHIGALLFLKAFPIE